MQIPEKAYRWARSERECIEITARMLRSMDKLSKVKDVRLGRERLPRTERPSYDELKKLFDGLFEEALQRNEHILGDTCDDKKLVSEAIFKHIRFPFRFQKALETGQFFPLPGESREVNCATQMAHNYAITKEWNLNPTIKEIGGFRHKGDPFVTGHAITEVEVGDHVPWVICQTMGLLGPITWQPDKKQFRVMNVIKKKTEEFEYTFVDTFTESEYAKRLQYQRSEEGAMGVLLNGQKVGFFHVDRWKSAEPLESVWYLRYTHDRHVRTLSSMVGIGRPFVQNRGLENKIRFDEDGNVAGEEITGTFYETGVWAAFLNAVPLFHLSPDQVAKLAKELRLTELSVDEQRELEDDIQRFYMGEEATPREGKKRAKRFKNLAAAIQQTYERLQAGPTFKTAQRFMYAEALYQHARNGKEFIFPEKDRLAHLLWKRYRADIHPDSLLTREEMVARIREVKEKHDRKHRRQFDFNTDTHGREITMADPRRRRSLEEECSRMGMFDMTLYQIEHEAYYVQECEDRWYFADNEIMPLLRTMGSLELIAQRKLGDAFDQWTRVAYARIFTELLAMAAHSLDQLQVSKYRDVVLDKVKKYRQLF